RLGLVQGADLRDKRPDLAPGDDVEGVEDLLLRAIAAAEDLHLPAAQGRGGKVERSLAGQHHHAPGAAQRFGGRAQGGVGPDEIDGDVRAAAGDVADGFRDVVATAVDDVVG